MSYGLRLWIAACSFLLVFVCGYDRDHRLSDVDVIGLAEDASGGRVVPLVFTVASNPLWCKNTYVSCINPAAEHI